MKNLSLLFSRRFGPLFSCMALGAFTDNYYKNSLIILITYVLAVEMKLQAEVLISLAAAFFILPFFLFSGVAGLIADRYPKFRLVRFFKITELILCVLIAAALLFQHLWSLMTLLFLLGMQSAFFGPVKYAILPELVKRKELLGANGLVEAGTFIAILFGTILGGLLVLRPHGVEIIAVTIVLAGIVTLIAAWMVPPTTASHPGIRLRFNILAASWDVLRGAIKTPGVRFSILGISWFWAIGATYLTQLPVFTKEVVGGDEEVVTLYMALFSIGIAVGSLTCHRIMQERVDPRMAPVALSGICLFGLDLCWAGTSIHHGSALIGLADYFTDFQHVRLMLDLFLLAVCGGLFIVPLYTQLQVKSSDGQRARAIASNNIMNALFMTVAALLTAGLYAVGWNVLHVLVLFGALNIPLMVYLAYRAKRLQLVDLEP